MKNPTGQGPETPVKLQVAVDLTSLDQALELMHGVAPSVDILEAGTPLIKQEGLRVVSAFKAKHPDKLVLADMKTMDAGELEADLAFRAGADLVTVLALAHDRTIAGAVAAARKHGRAVVADMIGIHDHGARARQLVSLGVDYVAVHSGLDEQSQGVRPLAEIAAVKAATSLPLLVVGGIDADTVLEAKAAGAAIVAVGHAICGAPDPAGMARRLRTLIG